MLRLMHLNQGLGLVQTVNISESFLAQVAGEEVTLHVQSVELKGPD